MISLGCAKNLVDAEVMLGTLIKDGVEITNDARSADVLVVNTCSFIDSAQEESVDTILESSALRDHVNPGQALVVSGCLPQRFKDELPRLLPEVDVIMGIDQVANVTDLIKRAVEHRRAKLANKEHVAPIRRGQQVKARLADSDRKAGAHTHDGEQTLRGTAQFGKTRQVVGTPSAPAQDPSSHLPAPTSDLPIVDVATRPSYIPDFVTPRFRLTPRHFAYVKIAEGCNHPCSFCIIPRMRGSHRSRAQADIVAEAKALIKAGVKELNLISQDSTYYGLDLQRDHRRSISSPEKFNARAKALPADATTLCSLIRELNALKGDFWIRLLYTHPAHWTDELIRTIAASRKVARYVDMPLQHIHEVMLERMRRETDRPYIENLITRIRAGIPGIALRTTFIVGFPGETEAMFGSLLEFIRATRFERLGVFTYSHEAGTRAGAMASQVSDQVKQRRRDQAMAAQHQVAQAVSESFVGRTLRVLVEGEAGARELRKANVSSWEHGLIREIDGATKQLKGRYLIARGEADAPDIDGRVYVRVPTGKMPVGKFAKVKIIGHTDYDLIAEPE